MAYFVGKKSVQENIMAMFDNCNGIIYTIKRGDTLYSLSRRFRVPLAKILRANPYIDIYNLQIGEQICIPKCPDCNPFYLMSYMVKEEETILDVLNRFGIELEDLLKYNNLNGIMLQTGSKLQIPVRRERDDNETEE
ncbi:MAG: LysM peptidoglycan-binding domain-containing protein [Lachnospiraceae bacterium]|nr:LysM peptidoglycan-binding domain-containing protein [Lachnospiraceae bacterium]